MACAGARTVEAHARMVELAPTAKRGLSERTAAAYSAKVDRLAAVAARVGPAPISGRKRCLEPPYLPPRRFDDRSAVAVIHLWIRFEPRDPVFQLVNVTVNSVPAITMTFGPTVG